MESAGDGDARRDQAPRRPGAGRCAPRPRARRRADPRRVRAVGGSLHRALGPRCAVAARRRPACPAVLAARPLGAVARSLRVGGGSRGARGSARPAGTACRRPGAVRPADRARPARPRRAEGHGVISTVEKVLFLKSIDLFRALPSEELAQIAEIAEEQPLAAGDQVFAQGEPGDALYLIVEGKVKVHQGNKELVRLGERDVFGEMAVLDSEPRSASVTAVEDAVLLKIGRDDFRDILGERPEIAMGVMKVLTRRLRETSRKS
ncbi:MAG: cyclic nucleotide-binding domain-containing protein [Deltaproteobacteria bacterium]|nr:MAG: cyclic nucleotide-binding domain-containing protein [Deltaproteobacteria bacterium]TMB33069.1 MAG: cyclic nucleotide-binding domain-containing protein [Deltaproteobacteria bacterium]